MQTARLTAAPFVLLSGLLTGLLITRLKVTPFIVTLGMLGIYRGVAKGISSQQMVSAPETWLNNLLTSLAPGEGWLLLPADVRLQIS